MTTHAFEGRPRATLEDPVYKQVQELGGMVVDIVFIATAKLLLLSPTCDDPGNPAARDDKDWF